MMAKIDRFSLKGGAWPDLNFERGVAGKGGGNLFQGDGGKGVGVAIFTKKIMTKKSL